MNVYGRQEFPEHSGATADSYLELLCHRRLDQRPSEDEPMKYTDLRWRMFSTMVGNPDEEWTAKALALGLVADSQEDPGALEAHTHAVRDTLHVLMADRWVEPVPFQRLLTVRLTATGRAQVRQLLLSWSSSRVQAGEGSA